MFVTLAYAELRTIFVRRAAEIRKLRPADLGLLNLQNLQIEIHEVLTDAKQDLFTKIRAEAIRMGVYRIWHHHGTFYARKTGSSSAVRVHDVADLAKLQD